MAHWKSLAAASGLAVMASICAAPAQAQEQAKNESEPNGEIVVTAAKRSESIQSVPISISAISGDQLEKSRTNSIDSLVSRVANLQLSSTVGDNTPIFALRGVSMSDYSLNQASPVATYYDEVYKGNFAFLGVDLFDLERVEVLRGPQGTLYGKNTTGGAVNLISRNAKLGETSGYLNAGYGNYNRVDLTGAINVPLGDKAALRLAGTFGRADGWFKNVVPGMPDLGEAREYGLRGSLYVEPSDAVRLTLRASTSFQNPHNYGIYAEPEAVNRPGLSTYEIASNIPDRRRARTYSISLNAEADLSDSLTLTSITSWDKGSLRFVEDTDGQSISLLEILYDDHASQFAQDLRLTSKGSGPFNFILGGYFAKENVYNLNNITIAGFADIDDSGTVDAADCALGLPIACQLRNQFNQKKESFAIYGDVNYKLADHVILRGGLRFTHDKGHQYNFTSAAYSIDNQFVAQLIPNSELRYSADNVSGKLGIDYKFDSANMLYANFSTGFRAPSFNGQAILDPSELSVATAEKVTSYEVGLKTKSMDRRLTFNAAAFYYSYRNQQFINVDTATGFQRLINIPKSRIYGAEAELTFAATPNLTLRAGAGALSTKILEGTVNGVDVKGNRLSNAPAFNFNAGIDLSLFDNSMGKLSVHPEVAYQSNQYFEVLNVPRLNQKGYALVNGHIDFESADGMWTASVWGKNLNNMKYFTSRIDLLGLYGFDYNHIGAPRTYGISIGRKF